MDSQELSGLQKLLQNDEFMFWFDLVGIICTVITVIMTIITFFNSKAARNYEKLVKYQKALSVYDKIQDIISRMLSGNVQQGTSYSSPIKENLESIKKIVFSKDIKKINKIIQSKDKSFDSTIASIDLDVQDLRNRKLDNKYLQMQKMFSEIQTYLKDKEEKCKGKIY